MGRGRFAIAVIVNFLIGIGVYGWGTQASENARLPLTGTLTVFAAASLTESFTALGERFESDLPGLRVLFNFAGSQTLRTQIEQGAPADVYASANVEQMTIAQKRDTIQGTPAMFAKNRLVVMVPRGNPGRVGTFRDLANPHLKLVLAGQHVPIGRYSREALRRAAAEVGDDFEARVLRNLVSEEHNVKQVVTKVQLGEADAGIVYASDMTPRIANTVQVIPIPDGYNLVATYPMAIVKGTRQLAAAAAFMAFVRSDQGRAILKSHHFIPAVE